MHHIMIGLLHTSFFIFILFISVELALEQTIKSIHIQNAQLQEMFLNLYKGQEELKALLAGNLAKKNSEDNKDERLEQMRSEVESMRTHMLGQMALIQGLAWRQ